MPNLLLDGAVVHLLYLNACGRISDAEQRRTIEDLIPQFDQIFYEAKLGQSHLQKALHSDTLLRNRLVALDEDRKPKILEGEQSLLRRSISEAEKSPNILSAIQAYERLKEGPARKRSLLLGYTARVLLLARELDACIWTWRGRMGILRAWFAEAGLELKAKPGRMTRVEFGPCEFPYLPSQPMVHGTRFYKFVDYEDYQLAVTTNNAGLASPLSRKARVFVSYSHKDKKFREQLEVHLATMKRRGIVETWSDRLILASADWKGEIDTALEEANIILLLVSADFCASDYCWDVEMSRALERHKNGEAKVIPVAIRPCDWAGAPFSLIQGVPAGLCPVSQWENRDAAWLDVVQEIAKVLSAPKE